MLDKRDDKPGSIGRARPSPARGFPEPTRRRARPTLGLLMLQTRFPRPPGDVGHPDTFAFTVRRRIVAGATPAAVVRARDPALLQPFIDAARALTDEGVDAIATSCGFLARWQGELQSALPVPVWTSALLHLAELRGQRCGVITIEAASLGADELRAVGADPATPAGRASRRCRRCIAPCCRTCPRWTWTTRGTRCLGRRVAPAAAGARSAASGARMHQPAALCRCAAPGVRAAGARHHDAAARAHEGTSAMNLRFVEAFDWAVTLKSVTRAAEKLYVTQSALSSRIAALEAELGVLLLDRRDKQFRLTIAGTRFHRHAERLLNLQRDIKAEFSDGGRTTSLRIGVIESVLHSWLVDWLQASAPRAARARAGADGGNHAGADGPHAPRCRRSGAGGDAGRR